LDQEDSEEEESEDSEEESEEEAPRPKKSTKSKKSAETSAPASGDRDELRRLMATDQKSIAATISSAAKADATKGKAVKEQRATFDALLNSRIKLQSGLTAVNNIAALQSSENGDNDDEMVDEEAIKSAETAALALWSTLEGLRSALADANSKDDSKKRKRPSPATPSTTTASLWERMSELESESLSHRRSILDKWSSKIRGTSASGPNARGKLLGAAGRQQTITAVLDAQVATEIGERSSKRARSSDEQEPLYDDGAFYQSLLRDLVEQRMSSSEAMTNGLDLHHLPSRLPIHPVTGMRNDKIKRDVDTRASKGRKMRYTVHEKLQNFMAPDDRASWTTRARDEFFASLLGRTASGVLGEGDESGSEAEDDDREEGGLRLFRN
jgi:protein AATF/BFR2